MVKIIGGEVVQDDDPRLRAPSRPAPDAGPSARRQPAGGPPVAAMDPIPLRAVPAPPGTALLNLPDLEVYGRTVRSVHLALAVGAVVVFGPRALLVVVLLWMISAAGDGPPGGDRQSARRRAAGAAGATRTEVRDFMTNYLSRPPTSMAGRERGEPGASGTPGSAAGGGAAGRGGGAGGRLGGSSGTSRLLGSD